MGRRSRKRSGATAVAGAAAPRPAGAPRPASARARRRPGERPKAPWHPFPLVELCVLAGLVLLVLGALDIGSDRGKILLLTGMALGSLGGLETALREHVSGYRSHTTLLASLPAVLVAGVLFFARVPWIAVMAGAAITFAVAFSLWRRTFRS
jgi:hypothetical protein